MIAELKGNSAKVFEEKAKKNLDFYLNNPELRIKIDSRKLKAILDKAKFNKTEL
jgi:hypothetical protein